MNLSAHLDRQAAKATSNPTESQKEAGNYAKGHVRAHGLDIAIENARGSYRRGVGRDGKSWSVRMANHYGYIKKSEGADGDHVDVYLGPHLKSPKIFVVDQRNADTGKFDEHKTFMGFASEQQVRAAYDKAFSDGRGPERMGAIAEMTPAEFREWLNHGDTTKPIKRASGGRIEMANGGAPLSDEAMGIGPALSDADMGIGAGQLAGQSATAEPTSLADTGIDVAKSAGVGVAKGAIGLAGLPGDLSELVSQGIDKLGLRQRAKPDYTAIPRSQDIQSAIEKNVTGEFYKPQGVPGEYAQTAGEFASGIIGGPQSLAARALTRIALPAAASETAGQLTKGTAAEPYARIVGAVGAPWAVQAATAAARPVANTVRGIVNPAGEADRRVAVALDRDLKSGNAGLTPQEVQSAIQSGSPVNALDIGGETARALARSAANTSPEGRAVLSGALDKRFEGQSNRITNWLQSTFHYPNATAQQEALDKLEKTVNRAAYQRAYTAGSGGLWSPELERLTSSPAVLDAMKKAVTHGGDRAVASGMGGFNPNVTFENGIVKFAKGPKGVPTFPDLQFWDYTHRNLRDASGAAFRSGLKDEGSALKNLSQTMRAELDRMVPEFAQARSGAARFFGAENALEAGQQFVTSRLSNRDARQALAKMSPQERQLFQDGFIDRFVHQLDEIGDRRSVLNTIANSPAARERLSIAMGPKRAKEFESLLNVEKVMDRPRSAVMGNSTTARQLAELGLAGGAYGIETGGNLLNPDPAAMAHAALLYGALRGRSAINHRVSGHVANRLAQSPPNLQAIAGAMPRKIPQQTWDRASLNALLASSEAREAPPAAIPRRREVID